MNNDRAFLKSLLRALLVALVSLVLIPVVTLAFTAYANGQQDREFVDDMNGRVAADRQLSADQKRQATEFYRAHPLSAACTDPDDTPDSFREAACPSFSSVWQFHVVERVAIWTIAGSALLFVVVLIAGAIAFAARDLLYASFVAGWRLTTVASALTVTVQSALLVWLSFWVTAYFMQQYFVKLVALAGIGAAIAVFFAVWTLFRKFPTDNAIDGEVLVEADAPRLWERVRQLARRLATAPPNHIVAGIDANFFVTESAVSVDGRSLSGRTMFVSIPLLRVLDQTEADAVLAHELAHLHGGDTRSSAQLGPKLHQFDHYCGQMRSGGLTIVTFYLLRLYRMIFSFALARDSRDREFLADRTAAKLIAPAAIVRSLVKIAAYASYRDDVERGLFAQDRRHGGAIGIAGFVAEGLHPYAGSAAFADAMQTASVPHPYDSHPPLSERMHNVAHPIDESAYGEIVTAPVERTWADDILTAEAIEARLWARYEERFATAHEENLAYRYEPSGEDELALVLRYFPPVEFALRKDGALDVTHTGLRRRPEGIDVLWDDVARLTFKGGTFGDKLIVTHHDKAVLRRRTTVIKLSGLGKQESACKAAIGRYWQRHQVMRAYQAADVEAGSADASSV